MEDRVNSVISILQGNSDTPLYNRELMTDEEGALYIGPRETATPSGDPAGEAAPIAMKHLSKTAYGTELPKGEDVNKYNVGDIYIVLSK